MKRVYEIGLSTCGQDICEDTFKSFCNEGIRYTEISLPYRKYRDVDYAALKKWSENYNVNIWSFHLPFEPFSEVELSKKECADFTLDYYSELMKRASDIGIDKFVVHPSGEPIEASERYERMERAKESLYKLAEISKKCGAVVAVENLPRTCVGKNSDEILELISVNESLGVCFDTNHLLCEDACNFIGRAAEKIVTVHISDYDFTDEKHWLPGEGRTDWQALLCALKNANYSGIWMYEVPFGNTAKIQRSRELVCEDFVRNANEIFENKPLTVIR